MDAVKIKEKLEGRKMKKLLLCITVVLICLILGAQAKAEQIATDLAKKTQNPVADLINVPFQFNTFFDTEPKGKTQGQLIVQPPFTDTQHRNHGLANVQFQISFLLPK